MTQDTTSTLSRIRRVDADKQIVYGVVYQPGVLDTYGEMMLADDIETMAHRFLVATRAGKNIDYMHDNNAVAAYPIESFIARKGDPDYPEGAWVLGVKVEDTALWGQIKRGEINAFSFEALVKKVAVVVEIEYDPEAVGITEANEDHSHLFYAQLDEEGRVVGGGTSVDQGHSHEIKRASATEENKGHSHRFFV